MYNISNYIKNSFKDSLPYIKKSFEGKSAKRFEEFIGKKENFKDVKFELKFLSKNSMVKINCIDSLEKKTVKQILSNNKHLLSASTQFCNIYKIDDQKFIIPEECLSFNEQKGNSRWKGMLIREGKNYDVSLHINHLPITKVTKIWHKLGGDKKEYKVDYVDIWKKFQDQENFFKEIKNNKHLDIEEEYPTLVTPDGIIKITPYAPSLCDKLKDDMNIFKFLKIIRDGCNGLAELHKHHRIHGNLNEETIIVAKNLRNIDIDCWRQRWIGRLTDFSEMSHVNTFKKDFLDLSKIFLETAARPEWYFKERHPTRVRVLKANITVLGDELAGDKPPTIIKVIERLDDILCKEVFLEEEVPILGNIGVSLVTSTKLAINRRKDNEF